MRTAIVLSLLLTGIACSRTNNDGNAAKSTDDSRSPDIHAARPEVTQPDNTGKNERDREPSAVTPEDQGNNEADLKITQQIRQGVMKLDNTSMDAKNVKIITSAGVVTLRGPVDSAQEKAEIARLAQNTSGVTRVDNQIEVKSSANEPSSNTNKNSANGSTSTTSKNSLNGSTSTTGKNSGTSRSGTTMGSGSGNLSGTTSGSNNTRSGSADRTTH